MNSKTRISTEDKIAYEFFESLQKIYTSINEIIVEISQRIKDVNEMKAYEEIQDIDGDIPNIGITLNNKIVEIYQQFKERGVRVFVFGDEKEGSIGISTLPSTLFIHLMNLVSLEAHEELDAFFTRQEEIATIKEDNWNKLEKSKFSVVNWIREKIWETRTKFDEKAVGEIYYSEEEVEELRDHIEAYRDLDTWINQYDMKEDIAESIVYFFELGQYTIEDIEYMLKNDIEPGLEEIGLKDQIVYIRKRIEEEFKDKHLKSWELPEEEKRAIQSETDLVASKIQGEKLERQNQQEEQQYTM